MIFQKLSIVLMIFIGVGIINVNDVEGYFLSNACGLLVTAFNLKPCQDDLVTAMKPFTDDGQNLPSFAACCEISIFAKCIAKEVKRLCGSAPSKAIKDLTKRGLTALSKITDLIDTEKYNCDGQWYYEAESPLCWAFRGPWGIVLTVGFIVLLACGCCCCCGCYRRRARPSGVGTTIVHMVPMKPEAAPAGPGTVPYNYLNNEAKYTV